MSIALTIAFSAVLVAEDPKPKNQPASANAQAFAYFLTANQNCQTCHTGNWQGKCPSAGQHLDYAAHWLRANHPYTFIATFADSQQGWITEGAPETLRVQLGLPKDVGVVVKQIGAESPAAQVGIMTGDVLVSLDGKDLKTTA